MGVDVGPRFAENIIERRIIGLDLVEDTESKVHIARQRLLIVQSR